MMYSHVGFGRKASTTCRMDRDTQLVGQSLNIRRSVDSSHISPEVTMIDK